MCSQVEQQLWDKPRPAPNHPISAVLFLNAMSCWHPSCPAVAQKAGEGCFLYRQNMQVSDGV